MTRTRHNAATPKLTLLALIMTILIACGGGGGGGGGGEDGNDSLDSVEGFWKIRNTDQDDTSWKYISLEQSGESVTGSFQCGDLGEPISGTISNDKITLYVATGSPTELELTGTVNGDFMFGTWIDNVSTGTWEGEKLAQLSCGSDGFQNIKIYGQTNNPYEVWVGNQSYRNLANWWEFYYSVSDYNYFKIADAPSGGLTNVDGAFKYYVIAIRDQANIDALLFDNSYYLTSSMIYVTGNLTSNRDFLYGQPDGLYGTVGLSGNSSTGGIYNGFIVIENENYQLPPISNIYKVWGGDTYISGVAGYNPERYGYTLLGQSQNSAMFSGAFRYYIITVDDNCFALIDSVEGSNGTFYGVNTTGNTQNHSNINGVPDNKNALLGLRSNGEYSGGYIVISPSEFLNSITVYVGS